MSATRDPDPAFLLFHAPEDKAQAGAVVAGTDCGQRCSASPQHRSICANEKAGESPAFFACCAVRP